MCSVAFPPSSLIFKAFTISSPFIHVSHPHPPPPKSLANTAVARDRTLRQTLPTLLQPSFHYFAGLMTGKFPFYTSPPVWWAVVVPRCSSLCPLPSVAQLKLNDTLPQHTG